MTIERIGKTFGLYYVNSDAGYNDKYLKTWNVTCLRCRQEMIRTSTVLDTARYSNGGCPCGAKDNSRGKRKKPRADDKLNKQIIVEIKKLRSEGLKLREIKEELQLPVSISTISLAINDKIHQNNY